MGKGEDKINSSDACLYIVATGQDYHAIPEIPRALMVARMRWLGRRERGEEGGESGKMK